MVEYSIVLVDNKRNIFTRRKIVCEIADTYGGAHVDPSLKEPYYNVSQANSLGWIHHDEPTGIDRALNDPFLLALDKSLMKHYSHLINWT